MPWATQLHSSTMYHCVDCEQSLSPKNFSNHQKSKPPEQRRCRSCASSSAPRPGSKVEAAAVEERESPPPVLKARASSSSSLSSLSGTPSGPKQVKFAQRVAAEKESRRQEEEQRKRDREKEAEERAVLEQERMLEDRRLAALDAKVNSERCNGGGLLTAGNASHTGTASDTAASLPSDAKTKVSLRSADTEYADRLKENARRSGEPQFSHYRERANQRGVSDEDAKKAMAEARKLGTVEYSAGSAEGFPDRFQHVASDGTVIVTDHLGVHGITVYRRGVLDQGGGATLVRVPSRVVGLLMGRRGCHVKEIQRKSGCKITVETAQEREAAQRVRIEPDLRHKLRGETEKADAQVENAIELIEAQVKESVVRVLDHDR